MHSLCEALRTNHIKTAKKHPSPSCSLGTDMKVITRIHKITYGASKGEWPQIFEELSQAENYLAKSRKKWASFWGFRCFIPISQLPLQSLLSSLHTLHALIIIRCIPPVTGRAVCWERSSVWHHGPAPEFSWVIYVNWGLAYQEVTESKQPFTVAHIWTPVFTLQYFYSKDIPRLGIPTLFLDEDSHLTISVFTLDFRLDFARRVIK